jgi:hypothetical protein
MSSPDPPKPRKRRRNVIGNSPHRDDYIRLMKDGWSSVALERYALWRYQEQIPASTFRTYRSSKNRDWNVSTSTFNASRQNAEHALDPDVLLDLLHERAELIRLQKARIAIDHEHEVAMRKLFGSTAREIEVLDKLLQASKGDLQDLGLFPKAGETVQINARVGALSPDVDDPQNRSRPTLASVLAMADPAHALQVARALHEALPTNGQVNGQVNGNGHQVIEGDS